jgi:endonuclease-3 related protein
MESDRSYDEFQGLFHDALPRRVRLYNEFHALLVRLGKDYCKKSEPLCSECPLSDMLLFAYQESA